MAICDRMVFLLPCTVLEDARSSERFCGHKCHFRL